MLSSPPFRMCGTRSFSTLRAQHLPSRSHQHDPAGAFGSHVEAARHLGTASSPNRGRTLVLRIAFMVPGLCTWSLGTAEVSTVPGRAWVKICHSGLSFAMPD